MNVKRFDILPTFLFLLVISMPLLVFTGYNFTKNSFLKKFLSSNLTGITVNTDKESLNIKNWFNHDFSNSTTKWFSENMPFRNYLVRLNNQLYFSLFQKSYMYDQTIIVGKKKELYEVAYIYDYLGMTGGLRDDERLGLAQNIRKVQDLFHKRGILFIVLTTPNKAYTYPEYIPDRYMVRPLPADRDYDTIPKLLEENGTNYVDGQKILLDERKKNGQELFPSLGTHWNLLGAGLVTANLMHEIGVSLRKPVYNIKAKEPFVQDTAGNVGDKDLYNLCNLLVKKDGYSSIDPVFETIGSQDARKLKVALVGDSFAGNVAYLMVHYGLVSQLDNYFYYTLGSQTFPEDKTRATSFSRVWGPRDFIDKDVVVLETNPRDFSSNLVTMFLEDCQKYLNLDNAHSLLQSKESLMPGKLDYLFN